MTACSCCTKVSDRFTLTRMLKRRGRAIIIMSRRARFESGLSESGRLSGLPLVHRVYFIVYAGESHAKPLMFGKTLSTTDDGRKSGVSGKGERERAREQAERGRYREKRSAACRAFYRLFFYHLELGKFSSPLSSHACTSRLFSSAFSLSFASVVSAWINVQLCSL